MADPWAGFQQVGAPAKDQWAGFSQVAPAPASDAETENVDDTKDSVFRNLMMGTDDQIESQKGWAPIVGGLVAGPVAEAAGPLAGGIMKVLGNPYVAGGVAGAKTLYTTHNPIAAMESAAKAATIAKVAGIGGGILARLKGLSAVASVGPAIAEATAGLESAAAPAAEAAPAAYRGIPAMMNIGGTAADDAAVAAQAARATQGARGASSIADMVQPAAQAVKAPAEDIARVGFAARAEDYAKSQAAPAAQSVADMVQPAAAEAAAAASAGESLMETRLRASILQKQNPQALTDEIVEKVKTLKEGVGKGLSAAQVGTSLEDLYGLGKSQAKNMAKMIFETMGYK